jgi:hypothetical protein
MKSALLVLLSMVCCCSWSCTHPQSQASDKYTTDGQKSYKEFRANIKSFPYSTSAERKNHILKNYPSLRAGMTKKQVAALIGDPDYSQPAYGPYGPKGPQGPWQGSIWSYVLFMREDAMNENDPKIQIFFGTDDLLHWAAPSGLSGSPEIGKCCS